uniref:Uncharacterized protein n=1 Tax=Micrurus corallinus TaxID=54390 RepID=A0A2D4FFD5_MICCO
MVREQSREEEEREEVNLLWIIEPVRGENREEGKRREMSLLWTIQAVLFAGRSSIPGTMVSKWESHGFGSKSSSRPAGRKESQQQHRAAHELEPERATGKEMEELSGGLSGADQTAELS